MLDNIIFKISIWALPVLLAITMHEAAHGWVAWKLGDDTAYQRGRVSFNPFRHIDPFGTIIVPALMLFASGGNAMFGFAKPVPVNFTRLRNPRIDMVKVALAGPGINLLMAIAFALSAHLLVFLPTEFSRWAAYNVFNAVWINILLCVFNMIPIPPLDGGRVAVGLLPRPLALMLSKVERFGFVVILGMIFIVPMAGDYIGIDLNVFWWLVGAPSEYLMNLLFALTGVA